MRNIIIKVAVIVLLLCHSTVSYSQEKPKSKKAKKHSFKKEMVHFGSSVTEKPSVNSNLALPATNFTTWFTNGNTITTYDGTEFIGTISDHNLVFKRNSTRAGYIGGGTYPNTSFGINSIPIGAAGGNTAFGGNALSLIWSGAYNTAVGGNSLMNTIGNSNTGIGYESLLNNYNGSNNTAIGYGASYSNIDGLSNTAIGTNSLVLNTTGDNNTAVGTTSLYNSTGERNTALGLNAGFSLTSGNNNIFIGANAGPTTNTSFSNRLFIGDWIFGDNGNIGIGVPNPSARLHTNGPLKFEGLSSLSNTTALMIDPSTSNVSTRDLPSFLWALNGNTLTTGNEYIGTNSNNDVIFKRNGLLSGKIGVNNTAFGNNSFSGNVSGAGNAAFGNGSLKNNNDGITNSAFGSNALLNNVHGSSNNAFGSNALENTTGSSNSAFGYSALPSNIGGNSNTAFGNNAGATLTSGDNNIFIGANTYPNISTTSSNQINIGNAIYGNNTNIGIGVLNPTAKFHTYGALKFQGLSPSSNNTALVIDPSTGSVSTRDLSSFLNTTTDSNIYDNDGNLAAGRTVYFDNNILTFTNNHFGFQIKTVSLIPGGGEPGSHTSILNVLDQENPITPNIDETGYFGIHSITGRDTSSLTQGAASNATWMQSAFFNGLSNIRTAYPLLINPLGGNVGIGLGATTAPSAQLHTLGTLKFQGLSPSSNTTALMIDPTSGSVTTRDLSSFLNPSSSTDWSLAGNTLTTGTEYVGTNSNHDLLFKRFGSPAGRIGGGTDPNTSFGLNALQIAAGGNSAFGANALSADYNGVHNTAIGGNCLMSNSGGNQNTGVGKDALKSNYYGTGNTAMGVYTAQANINGQLNSSFGLSALATNQSGNYNTAIGTQSLVYSTGNRNSAFGTGAGYDLTAGDNNIFIGAYTTPNISNTASNQINIGNAIYGSKPDGINTNIGINVPQPQARLHTTGTLRFDALGTNTSNTNFLTTDAYGNVTTRDLNSFITPPSNINIYNSDGGLDSNRTVKLDKYSLTFQDNNHDGNHLIIDPDRFSDKNDSFLSVKLIRKEFFQIPNLHGWGMSNIAHPKTGITLTQGLWDGDKKAEELGGNWLQSSIVDIGPIRDMGRLLPSGIEQPVAPEDRSTTFPLLLNPLGGNVGVGLTNPTAQLHVINTVRFQNLDNPERKPDWLLGTDLDGNVYEYDPNIFASSSDTDDWKLAGNWGTDPSYQFIGTVDNKDFVVRTANSEKFRFTDSPTGRIIVNGQVGSNYNQNFYIGGGNSLLLPSASVWGPIAANTAIGYGTLLNNTSGNTNTALGSNALGTNLTGNSNIGIGVNALLNNKAGTQNVAIGVNALSNAGTSSTQVNLANTALGNQSFQALTTGQGNVGLGSWSGFNQTGGNNNILIGSVDTPRYNNSSVNTAASNQLNIGGWITGDNGNIGIGLAPTVLPAARLHTSGPLRFNGLGTNIGNTKILTLDNTNGDVTTRELSTIIPTTTNVLSLTGNNLTSNVNGIASTVSLASIIPTANNIYTNNGTLGANRIVAMNGKTLRFNFGTLTSPSPSEVIINPDLSTQANMSVAAVRSDVPNLAGNGMSRLDRKNNPTASSFFTTGYNSNYFWTQASNPGTSSPTAANYMINPNGGKVAIGTLNVDACSDCGNYRLFVAQGIRTEKVRVDIAAIKGWADYVFDSNYKLMPLKDLETYIEENKHLPNIPKAEEVAKTGIDLGEMNAKLLEKIEELTLHTIEINKKNETLEKSAEEQKALIQSLVERLEKLENKTKQ